MTTTIEELEKRVAALERELSSLRQEVGIWMPGEILVESERDHAAVVAAWEWAMEQMGIHGKPIGAEKLQEMMRAHGVKPEDNILSRGIIEMREE
jgi:hypothetical protein